MAAFLRVGCAVVAGVGMASLFVRRLRRQLGGEPATAVAVARAVAAGDLGSPVPVDPGDTESLMAQLLSMQTALVRAVSAVREGSEQVAATSGRIAQSNRDLSTRTEEQAAALEQTAATMEQLGTTVQHNAQNALQASEVARASSQIAAEGGVDTVIASGRREKVLLELADGKKLGTRFSLKKK